MAAMLSHSVVSMERPTSVTQAGLYVHPFHPASSFIEVVLHFYECKAIYEWRMSS